MVLPESEFPMAQLDQLPDAHELVQQRERYFKAAPLDRLPVYCGDERPAIIAGMYIHVFGGVGFQAFNLAVMQETADPGSVKQPYEDLVATQVPLLREHGVEAGVHSDEHSEHSDVIDIENAAGDLGCGYLQKRAAISQLLTTNPKLILKQAFLLRPDLFGAAESKQFADRVVEAQGRLVERPGFLTSGRQVARKAIQHGAPSIVVKGDHSSHEAFVNYVPETSFDTAEANLNRVPTYDHDQWAAMAMFDMVRPMFPYDKKQYEIAATVDAVATMVALGVTTIAARH